MEAKGQNGTVVFDGTFITIRRTGFVAKTSTGGGEKRIPLSSIGAVQYRLLASSCAGSSSSA